MIHIVTASHLEAKPIIERYSLSRLKSSRLYEIFINDEKTIATTICGIGKLSSAAAVIYSSQLVPTGQHCGWLNIGIAGHKSLSIGTPALASKITDCSSNKSWYPQVIFDNNLTLSPVLTVDNPTSQYPDEEIIDMEASGFYSSAARLETCELIHCFKIISDNEDHHFKEIDSDLIKELVHQNLEEIDGLIGKFQEILADIPIESYDNEIFEYFTAHLHFTYSEKLQLIKTLKRWCHLVPDKSPDTVDCASFTTARQLLDYLIETMDKTPIRY